MNKRKRLSNNGVADYETSNLGESKHRGSDDYSNTPIKQQAVNHGRVDPNTGQRSAIPGLDDYSAENVDDGELECEDGGMQDALQYLRNVRAEASSIPSLLVAPKPQHSIYDNGVGDSRGFYQDGAYTAAPSTSISTSDLDAFPGGSNAQTKYYAALMVRYEKLREQFMNQPPEASIERLDWNHPRTVRADGKDWRAWRRRIAETEPWPAQLVGMDRESVLRLLRIIFGSGGFMQGKGEGLSGRTSRWIWGLMAQMPEPGEMGSEEVGVVRELGKKAILVSVGLMGVDTTGLDVGDDDEVGDDEMVDAASDNNHDETEIEATDGNDLDKPSVEDHTSIRPFRPPGLGFGEAPPAAEDDTLEELASARARILESLSNSVAGQNSDEHVDLEPEVPVTATNVDVEDVRCNTHATLEMIITIVGEVYGQRDLLGYRKIWK